MKKSVFASEGIYRVVEVAEAVTVIAGPARSGKTAYLLEKFHRQLTETPEPTALWLAPSPQAAADIRLRLLCDRPDRPVMRPNVVTFDDLAQTTVARSRDAAPMSEFRRRQVLRRIIKEAAEQDDLQYLGPIADQPGLLDLVAGFIDELKRLEVRSAQFAVALQAGKQSGRIPELSSKDHDLWRLYDRYQSVLKRHGLCDLRSAVWHARDLMRNTGGRFDHLEVVIADGFASFTPTERDILQVLAGGKRRLMVVLPFEDEPRRSGLFDEPARTLAELRRRHAHLNVEYLSRSAKPTGLPAVAHIEEQIFHSPDRIHRLDDPTGVELIEAAGQVGELEWVARRVKQLLWEGDPDAGTTVRPTDVAIVIRPLEACVDLVREVMAEFGVPVAVGQPKALIRNRRLHLLTSLVELELGDWPFRKLLSALDNQLLGAFWETSGGEPALRAAELVVRDLQLPQGRRELFEAVRRWAQITPGKSRWKNVRIQRAKLALPVLEQLGGALAELPTRATFSQWSKELGGLGSRLLLIRTDDLSKRVASGDLEAESWRRLASALDDEELVDHWLGHTSTEVTLAELHPALADILERNHLPSGDDDAGRVRVLDAEDARHLSVPYLFFAGLSERSFPGGEHGDRFHGEADVRRLNEAGLGLPDRAQRTAAEMLLFYQVCTRATRRMWLSYPALDAKAQPLSPSPYLLELERVCGSIPRRSEIQLSPVPSSRAFCPRDLRVKAVADALQGDAELLGGLCKHDAGRSSNVLAALRMAHHRQSGSSFGAYEGVCGGSQALSMLSERFGPSKVWSASQLEQYASCPYRFFLERVVGLDALEDPALEDDYALRGRLAHAVIAAVHRRLNELGQPTSPCSREADDFAREAIEVLEEIQHAARSDGTMSGSLRELYGRLVSQWLGQYQRQHRDYEAQLSSAGVRLLPTYFEIAFGPPASSEGDELADPAPDDGLSTREPFVLECGEETVKLSGRIDRIDVGQIGNQTVFNVVDYKTGSSSKHDRALAEGRLLQLPLYALAVQELLMADRGAVPLTAGYWHVKAGGHKASVTFHEPGGDGLQLSDQWRALKPRLIEQVTSVIRGLRSGHFPVYSADPQCTSRCEFHTVCRVGQSRALEKTWPPADAVTTE